MHSASDRIEMVLLLTKDYSHRQMMEKNPLTTMYIEV